MRLLRLNPRMSGIAALGALSAIATADEPTFRVSLAAAKKAFVLGEPVTVEMTVVNLGAEAVEAIELTSDGDDPAWQILASTDGKAFRRVQIVDGSGPFVVPVPRRRFEPGQPVRYARSVLYSKAESKPAFPGPAKYSVKAVFPLRRPRVEGRLHFESAPVEIEVKSPTGEDAKAWELLKSQDMLRFVQFPGSYDSHKQLAAEVADVLAAFPNTAYAPHLRSALRSLCRRQTLAPNVAVRVASMSGCSDIDASEDKRLDVLVGISDKEFPAGLPLARVADLLQEQSGVGLAVAGSLAARVWTNPNSGSLKKLMLSLDRQFHAWWHPWRGGYILIADEDIEDYLPKLAREAQR
jgi:hypothetical protein